MNKIFSKLEIHAKNEPQKIALSDGAGEKISYRNLFEEISALAASLENKGFKSIAILADNSPSWIIFDLACLKAGIVLIPIPHFFTDAQISKIVDEAMIEAVLSDETKNLPLAILKKENLQIAKKNFSLLQIASQNSKTTKDFCKITFTSGSTGEPKGVRLTASQIENVVFAIVQKLQNVELAVNLSLLPLSVLLENIAGVYCSLMLGSCAVIPSLASVGISGSSSVDVEKFARVILASNPSSFIVVPELAKLLVVLVEAKKIPVSSFKFIAVGGAKVAPDLLQKAANLGLPLYQGYGLSEVASVVALNSPKENKIGSVGKILSHLEVTIAADGEILIKGNSADQYSDSKALDKEGEWYKTGDIGHFDDEDFLFITGRKKNIFITSFGRNVNPEWSESELLKSPLIQQVAVFGEAKPFNVAVIFSTNPNQEILQNEIDSANRNLPDYAQIKKIILAKSPFSVANKMLTGTGRIRREEIYKNYRNEIEKFY